MTQPSDTRLHLAISTPSYHSLFALSILKCNLLQSQRIIQSPKTTLKVPHMNSLFPSSLHGSMWEVLSSALPLERQNEIIHNPGLYLGSSYFTCFKSGRNASSSCLVTDTLNDYCQMVIFYLHIQRVADWNQKAEVSWDYRIHQYWHLKLASDINPVWYGSD